MSVLENISLKEFLFRIISPSNALQDNKNVGQAPEKQPHFRIPRSNASQWAPGEEKNRQLCHSNDYWTINCQA